MPRRTVPAILFAAAAGRALTRQQVLDAVQPLAEALAVSDPHAFLRPLPKDMPGRDELRANVEGLIAQAEIACSIDPLSITDDSATLDWHMEIRSRARQTVIERRRGEVRIAMDEKGGLRSIEPASFFRPAS